MGRASTVKLLVPGCLLIQEVSKIPTSGCPFLSAFYQLSFSLPALDFQAAVADLEKISFGGQGTLCCHRRWEGDRDHSVFFLLDRDVEGSNVTARVLRHPKESSDS